MTHEAGHFVGLGHSDVRGTTMWPKAGAGETEKRTLHEDDVDGVIALYPTSYYRPEPERSFQDSPNTDTPRSAPRNGQESPTTEMPAQPTIRVTCSAATPGSAAPSSPVWLLGLGLLGLLALVRHRTNA